MLCQRLQFFVSKYVRDTKEECDWQFPTVSVKQRFGAVAIKSSGLAGLVLTDENAGRQKRIVSLPESSKDEMFEQTKKEFLRENGTLNGDTTRRRDVYDNLYRKTKKDDRLAAGYTMEQYERAYRQAFLDAARKANPKWEIGKPVPSGALDGITRESVEANLRKSGRTLSSVDMKI